ncbi:MAG TPA: type II toxin-antitoxin system RelE/ParE family toxin [Terriglobales bacterium]
MKGRRLVLSDAAMADILDQADWYATQSGPLLGQRWEKAVTSAVSRLVRRPASGTPCAFRSPALRGVRRTFVAGFPKHLLFYRFDDEQVLILRVVHGARDLDRLF